MQGHRIRCEVESALGDELLGRVSNEISVFIESWSERKKKRANWGPMQVSCRTRTGNLMFWLTDSPNEVVRRGLKVLVSRWVAVIGHMTVVGVDDLAVLGNEPSSLWQIKED